MKRGVIFEEIHSPIEGREAPELLNWKRNRVKLFFSGDTR